jgi:hypothetical protein
VTELDTGARLHGTADEAQFIVVRAPSAKVDLLYGGEPLATGSPPPAAGPAAAGTGVLLGKRYVHEPTDLELLCVKAGGGDLTVEGQVLPAKSAKPLPASD